MNNNLVGLIDADFIKYLVAYDIERMFKNGLDSNAIIPYNTIAILTQERINKIEKDTIEHTKAYIYLFSGKTRDGFRSTIACVKPYKGNRKYIEKYKREGEYRSMVEKYINEHYTFHKETDLEADDLCIMGHKKGTYIYSKDKDLAMSPGIHYNTYTNKFINTSKDEGFKILMTQTLCGDSVDNISGVDGVGKIGAPKLIKGIKLHTDIINKVIDIYTTKYGAKDGLDRFVEMYTLINLRTNRGDWTKKKYNTFFEKIDSLIKENNEIDFI